jgi:tellurite resistance protein TerC
MLIIWVCFILFILTALSIDLGVFNREVHVVTTKESLKWTGIWIVTALVFNVLVYYLYTHHILGIGLEIGHPLSGHEAALQFFTGWLIEYSLSLDNIFVFAIIFVFFGVPKRLQQRVLFWGIIGALVLRGMMIAAGTALINRFEWMIYVFGVLLLFTAVKMLRAGEEEVDPDRNILVIVARKFYPVTSHFEEEHFFTKIGHRKAITPLFLVVLVIASTDMLFAVDSIPSIFAITRDPFLVFTSNVFAVLGLRSLFFAITGLMAQFEYLRHSLVFLLSFVGIKMLLSHHYPIPITTSLAVIAGILSVGIIASMISSKRRRRLAYGVAGLPNLVDESAEENPGFEESAPSKDESDEHTRP